MTREDAGIEGPTALDIERALADQALVFKDSFPAMLGITILEAEPGSATGSLVVGPAVRNPGGTAHGGAIAGFGDTVAAWATFPALGPRQSFTTIEFKATFVAGVTDGVLIARAKAIHQGARTMVLDVRITEQDTPDRLVAIMLVTQAILGERSPA